MYPARTSRRWLGTSASAGSSRRVRRNRVDIRSSTATPRVGTGPEDIRRSGTGSRRFSSSGSSPQRGAHHGVRPGGRREPETGQQVREAHSPVEAARGGLAVIGGEQRSPLPPAGEKLRQQPTSQAAALVRRQHV